MFINVISEETELAWPLQAWNAIKQNLKMGNNNGRYFMKVMFISEFHPHIDHVWVNIKFKQLTEC